MADTEAVKAKFRRYEEVKLEIKKLEEEADELKPELIALMPEDMAVETDLGAFTLKRRTKWVYSSETQKAEAELKDKKKDEERTGVAKAIDGDPYLEYREKKSAE